MASPVDRVRERVVTDHADVVATVEACADRVAARRAPATDRASIVEPLGAELRDAGVYDRFPTVILSAVEAAGLSLPADPVAAPPYVAVTSRGPILRATLSAGRLVVRFVVFDVERDPVRYVRSAGDPVQVELR